MLPSCVEDVVKVANVVIEPSVVVSYEVVIAVADRAEPIVINRLEV